MDFPSLLTVWSFITPKKMNKLALQVESPKEMKEKDFNEEHSKSSIKRGSKHPLNLMFFFQIWGNFFKNSIWLFGANWRGTKWWKGGASILILHWEVLAEGNCAFCCQNCLKARKNPKCTVWPGILTTMIMLIREEQRKLHALTWIFLTMLLKRFHSKRRFVGFASMFFDTQICMGR